MIGAMHPTQAAGTGIGNYNTVADDNGPSHMIIDGLFLGELVDDEGRWSAHKCGSGDDTNPPDALRRRRRRRSADLAMLGGDPATVDVTVTNLTDRVAFVYGWIDFNTNGVFELSERASASVAGGSNSSIVNPQLRDSTGRAKLFSRPTLVFASARTMPSHLCRLRPHPTAKSKTILSPSRRCLPPSIWSDSQPFNPTMRSSSIGRPRQRSTPPVSLSIAAQAFPWSIQCGSTPPWSPVREPGAATTP